MEDGKMFTESFESEELASLIESKKKSLSKIENEFVKKNLQKEILFLEKRILPIVLRETTLFFSEVYDYVHRRILEAIQLNCNAMLCLIPLKENDDDVYMIGVANPKGQKLGKDLTDSIDVSIDNFRIGSAKIEPVNIPLDE